MRVPMLLYVTLLIFCFYRLLIQALLCLANFLEIQLKVIFIQPYFVVHLKALNNAFDFFSIIVHMRSVFYVS